MYFNDLKDVYFPEYRRYAVGSDVCAVRLAVSLHINPILPRTTVPGGLTAAAQPPPQPPISLQSTPGSSPVAPCEMIRFIVAVSFIAVSASNNPSYTVLSVKRSVVSMTGVPMVATS